jgi:hypothetical protein
MLFPNRFCSYGFGALVTPDIGRFIAKSHKGNKKGMVILPRNFYPQVESLTTGAAMGMIGKFFDFCYSFAVDQGHKNGVLGFLASEWR